MPELPEVEVVRRGLERHVVGRTIGSAQVLHPRAVRRHEAGPDDFSAAARGLGIVVISHDIPKMLGLADRIAVMRQGRTVVNTPARELTLTDVVTLMLGGQAKGEAA